MKNAIFEKEDMVMLAYNKETKCARMFHYKLGGFYEEKNC